MVKYESKYDIPARTTDLKIDLDIFGKKSQKISTTIQAKFTKLEDGVKMLGDAHVVSKGFDLDIKQTEVMTIQSRDFSYENKLNYHLGKMSSNSELVAKLNMKEAELLLKLFNKELIHANSKLQLSKDKQLADTTVSTYGLKPLVTHLEIKDFNTVIYSVARKDTPKNKLQISSGLVLGQIADFRAEVIKGANKEELVHASVKLDDANFMKPDFGINVNNIHKMLLVRYFVLKFHRKK